MCVPFDNRPESRVLALWAGLSPASMFDPSLRSRLTGVLLAGLLLAILPAAVSAADRVPVAGLVVASEGEVTVHHASGSRPAPSGSILREGDTLLVAVGAACRGFDPSGRPFELAGPAETIFSQPGTGGALAPVRAWIARQLADWAGSARDRPLLTRSARSWDVSIPAPAPLLPGNGGTVRSGRGRLTWSAIPGVERYEVTWVAGEGAETSRIVNGTNLSLDALPAGVEYLWKVRPAVEGWPGTASWTTFRVLPAEEERALDLALAGLDDLEAGVLLLSGGLHEDAILHLDAAVGGTQARAAHLWRARALSDLGLYKQAFEDLEASGP